MYTYQCGLRDGVTYSFLTDADLDRFLGACGVTPYWTARQVTCPQEFESGDCQQCGEPLNDADGLYCPEHLARDEF